MNNERQLEEKHHPFLIQPDDIAVRNGSRTICDHVAYYTDDRIRGNDDDFDYMRLSADLLSLAIRRRVGRPL